MWRAVADYIDPTESEEGLEKYLNISNPRHLIMLDMCFDKFTNLIEKKNIENIVAVKEASGNISQISKIMQLTDGKIDLYSGNDDQIVPLLSVGGKGVISVLANVAPQYTHDICAKFFEGDVKGSCKMQLDAIPLIEKLFCEVNPIPVKKALNLMGWQAGPLRMPLTEMTEAHTAQLAKELEAFGIKLA